MVKPRNRKANSLPMRIGNDPALWRFADLQEALEANSDLLSRLIHAGQEVQHKPEEKERETSESDLLTRGNSSPD